MSRGPASVGDEPDYPLSPELALVDPDLALAARERLEPPQPPPRRPPAVELDPASDPIVPAEPGSTRRRQVVWALVAGVGAGALALAVSKATVGGSQPAASAPGAVSRPRAPGTTAAPTTRGGHVRPTPKPATVRSRGAAQPLAATRRFVWVKSARATYYEVQFFRAGARILDRRVEGASLTLPAHWTYRGKRYALARGRYRWVVRPGFGRVRRGRLGAPIVDSALDLR